jgi:parvulin-like peptidyl-prolyl isomerase
VTLRLLLMILLASLAAGCAGAAASQVGDPYAPAAQSAGAAPAQPAADAIGPGQRYPLRSPPPPAPKLTISEETSSANPDPHTANQATATEAIDKSESLFVPPAAVGAPDQAAPQEQELFAPGQIVARVADQIILYGDVAPMADQTLAPHMAKAKSAAEREEILSQRELVVEQLVRQMIETKLLFYEALREVPRDKLDEAKKNMRKQVSANFESGLNEARREVAAAKKSELEDVLRKDPVLMRLAWMMNEQGLETTAELDAALRQQGSSLAKQLTFLTEYHVGRSILPKRINFRPEVTHQEMLDHYREHAADFAVPAKARFEIMTVYYKNYPTEQAAERALSEMGNAVYLGGASFAAVAQKSSQEPGASKGGQYDWTSKGSLASQVIDEAIFTLPVGKLSQILRDERGCHILRVQERQDASQISFVQAQEKIKDAIVSQKRNAEYKKYLEGLRETIPVWTIYDDKNLARQQRGGVPR